MVLTPQHFVPKELVATQSLIPSKTNLESQLPKVGERSIAPNQIFIVLNAAGLRRAAQPAVHEILRVSFIQNVGTVWVYSEDSGPGLNGEAPSAESQHANFGSFAQSSGWTGSNGFLVSHLPPGAVSLVAAIALQKWLNSWFLARATRFLGDAAANLTARLAGEGLLRAGGRVVVRVLGRIALFGVKWLIGPIIGSLIALGLQELWSYLMKEYVLLCRVVNYDAHATYTVTDAYGVNEEITDPDFAASEIPMMDLAGTQRTIPGLPFPITIDENIAY
ncbi:hypothetical protein GGX14DRAFT_394446 [Mycena pura]|uniref:Uncharacterized protein n=1 Tax=Mycena pura TaxID=153505 RepID=A0AAD6VM97_9AGAR|nr:hypothetical protein GGX14DRAFT_394446 [Mycena pura]